MQPNNTTSKPKGKMFTDYEHLAKLFYSGTTFVAFDTETTGLSPASCRVIEVGAVSFRNGQKHRSLGTVVQSCLHNPCEFVNHITGNELLKAPKPCDIYPVLLDFFEQESNGPVLLVGHNANFDMRFLEMELSLLDLDVAVDYVDTMQLARQRIILPNYKQGTIERYFGLHNEAAHRAKEDAETCGNILLRLLDLE